jgi:hypothetical protein
VHERAVDERAVDERADAVDVEDRASTPAPTPVTSVPGEVSDRPRPVAAAPPAPAAPAASSSGRAQGRVEAPPDRADLLARLRERAGKLAPERLEAILSSRR